MMTDVIKGKCGTDCNTCSFREQFSCKGCDKMDGHIFWGDCDIYECSAKNGYQHCGECGKLPCDELQEFIKNGHNPDRLQNLEKWKNEG